MGSSPLELTFLAQRRRQRKKNSRPAKIYLFFIISSFFPQLIHLSHNCRRSSYP